jgi:zinc/manganese transport system permease protein
LVLALLVTPAAAAMQVSANPAAITALSVIFAVLATEGGILLATGSTLPISPYVTTISFVIFLICRGLGGRRVRRGWVST